MPLTPEAALAPTPQAEPLLTVTGLTTEILTPGGVHRVVDGLSFDVLRGEIVAMVGESGSGKSLAMQSLLGLLPQPPATVVAGSAVFEGSDLLRMSVEALRGIRGNRIGMIFQEPMTALNPMMPVGDQIAETLVTHRGLGWSEARRETVRLLDQVRIADAPRRARLHPHALSGGMRQRIVIAAAIACKPGLLVADEPTTALDATVQAEILALLDDLRREVGCSIILITHDMGVVRSVAERVVVMHRGRAVERGRVDTIFANPADAYTRTLIAASLPASAALRGDDATVACAATPLLSVRDLVVSFPHRASLSSFGTAARLFAVDGVSLSLDAGETLALVGESGSGKTTVARAILGLAPVEDGQILIAGKDAAVGRKTAGGRVQFVFQDPQSSLDPRFKTWRSATEPLFIGGIRDRAELRRHAARLFDQVGLSATHLDRFPHELSGGQRQRLGIARALSVEPSILIADEAVSALDATTRLQILDLFQGLQNRIGLAYLFITHDFAVVTRIAHRVAVMRFGRIVEIGPTAAVLAEPAHPYTRTLLASASGVKPAAVVGEAGRRGHRIAPAGAPRDWRPLVKIGPGHFAAAEEM